GRWRITSLLINQRESLLLQLSHPHHCIGVDLYSGKEVFIGPMVSYRSGAAQLDLYPLLHQPGDELSVGISGLNWMTGLNTAIGVIGIVVQQEIDSVSVKDGNNFTFDVPATEVSGEKIHVSEKKGISLLSTRWPISNTTFAFSNFTGMSM